MFDLARWAGALLFDRLEPAVVKVGGVGFAGICTDYACFAEVDHQGKGNQELDCRIVL